MNGLRLNVEKTKMILFHPSYQIENIKIFLLTPLADSGVLGYT